MDIEDYLYSIIPKVDRVFDGQKKKISVFVISSLLFQFCVSMLTKPACGQRWS